MMMNNKQEVLAVVNQDGEALRLVSDELQKEINNIGLYPWINQEKNNKDIRKMSIKDEKLKATEQLQSSSGTNNSFKETSKLNDLINTAKEKINKINTKKSYTAKKIENNKIKEKRDL